MKFKKRIVFPILFSVFACNVYAFEVYGLKSGMTKSEYYELTDCQAYVDNYNSKKSKYSEKEDLKRCLSAPSSNLTSKHPEYGYSYMPYFDDIEPKLSLSWTHDDRLWRVQVTSVLPGGILPKIAFRKAFAEAFPGKEIKESEEIGQYSTTEYLTVMFIDNEISDESIEHHYKKFLLTLNKNK